MKVGDIVTKTYIRQWHECQICGLPAVWRMTFLYHNCRTNPASSAYLRDDCSWCSDEEAFACKKHKGEVQLNPPTGMSLCATILLAKFKPMGFLLSPIREENKGGVK